MSYLDNLYRPPMYEDREILSEEYLLEHNIDIDDELIDFINENYEVLQALLDEGYDITDILNERTLYTYTPDKNDGYGNLRRILSNDERKYFDIIHKHLIHQTKRDEGVLKFKRDMRNKLLKGLPISIPEVSDMQRKEANAVSKMIKNKYSNEDVIANNHMYIGKIGINKLKYKQSLNKKKQEIDPNLSTRKQQIKDRLLKSNLFLNLPQEKRNQLLRKIDKKSLAFTMRGILNHEKEHGNQYDIIKKELGNGSKIGEYKALTKAAKRYGNEVKNSNIGLIPNFRKYGSTPFEYGANLKARNQLTPQQSKELALHQVDPKKYPLKSIKINPDKAEYMALHPLYQLKDNRGRLYNYDKKKNDLSKRVNTRANMEIFKYNPKDSSITSNLLTYIKNRFKH